MQRDLLILILFLLATNISLAQTAGAVENSKSIDSVVTIFNDQSYKFILHVFDPGRQDEEHYNAIVRVIKLNKKKNDTSVLYRAPIYCAYPSIEFRDFNNDGFKDILVLHTSSARSNRSYYLYIITRKKAFIPVIRFPELLNPVIDKKTGIITCTALYGDTQSFSFYKISKSGGLRPVGKEYSEQIK